MRGIFCNGRGNNIIGNVASAHAASRRSFGVRPRPRGGISLTSIISPSPFKCSSSIGCFCSSAKRSTCSWRTGTGTGAGTANLSSSFRLFGSSIAYSDSDSAQQQQKQKQPQLHHSGPGPVIHRSDSPTHLDQVEDAINSSLSHYHPQYEAEAEAEEVNPINFPPRDREAIGVASNLQRRLRGLANSGDCRRCWLQRKHCVCDRCISLEEEGGGDVADEKRGIPNVDRLFLLTHHKEICLAVDTAKLILAAFPSTTRLVVSGIGREFQPAMGEMLDAVSDAANNNNNGNNDNESESGKHKKCLILFPTEDAITFEDIILREEEKEKQQQQQLLSSPSSKNNNNDNQDNNNNNMTAKGWDVIVIDGTWSQARKMHSKYFGGENKRSEGSLYRVQLSDEAVKVLDGSGLLESGIGDDDGDGNDVEASSSGGKGHQLRRHPIKWREISTLEATRLLLNDMHTANNNGQFDENSRAMARYQEIGDAAARRQLGPPRVVVQCNIDNRSVRYNTIQACRY